MNIVQKLFDKTLSESFSFQNFMSIVTTEKLEAKGIILSELQIEQLRNYFEQKQETGSFENINFTIEDDGAIIFETPIGKDPIFLEYSDVSEKIDELKILLPDIIQRVMDEMVEEQSKMFSKGLREDADKAIIEERENHSRFEKELLEIWEKPLHLLEVMIDMAEGLGGEYDDYIRTSEEVELNEENKLEALARLQARSCQVAKEIVILLKNGFPDGAHARWRTLHEIVVIMNFINQKDDELAERYLHHHIIDAYKTAKIYQENCLSGDLGYEPIPEDEYNQLRVQAEALKMRYGKSYEGDYGWAAQILSKKAPTFADIEKATNLQHTRHFYKLACVNVHAGSRGLFLRLGLNSEQQGEILLSGSSILGLADPGQNTAYSLLLSISSLLSLIPNLDTIVALKIFHELEIEIYEAFEEADYRMYQLHQEDGKQK